MPPPDAMKTHENHPDRLLDKSIIVVMAADPHPEQAVIDVDGKRAVGAPDAGLPEPSHALEVQ